LLRTDVERYAVRVEAERLCMTQHVDSHRRHATELARQRPFSALTIGQHTAEHTATWSSASDFFDFFNAINCIEANAQLEGARNIALLLDGVAIRDAVWRCTGFQCHFDF